MKVKNILAALLGMALACVIIPSGTVVNAAGAEYTYTVKIHLADADADGDGYGDAYAAFNTDANGELKEGSIVVSPATGKESYCINGDTLYISNISYGTRITFSKDDAVTVGNNGTTYTKYFAKGIRQSGRNDYDRDARKASFVVDKDLDYVIAYSVGNIVPYKVRYVDEEGNTLYDEQTFYGPENEAISVSSRYIAGYVPNTYNYDTKSLVGPKEVNGEIQYTVFEFVYHKGEASAVETETSYVSGGMTYIYSYGPDQYVTIPGQAAGGAGGGAAAAGGDANQAQDQNQDQDNTTIADDEVPLAPEEIISIDDEETPLSGFIEDNTFSIIAVIIVVIALITLIISMILFSKKKKKNVPEKKDEEKDKTVE